MVRISLIVAGWLFILIGCLLLLMASLRQVSNFSESNYVRDHYAYSTPGAFEWSAWQPNDGSVTHIYRLAVEHQRRQEGLAITEFRRGVAHGFLFDFIAYEGRSTDDNTKGVFPAMGPDWGAQYNFIWAFSALLLGIVSIFASRFFKPRGNGDLVP
jgi:hypothetical protein